MERQKLTLYKTRQPNYYRSIIKTNHSRLVYLEIIIGKQCHIGRYYYIDRKSPVVMYLVTLNYLIESDKLTCVSMQQSRKTYDFDIIIHEGKYFIRSFKVYEAVKGYLSSKGIAFELSERKVRELLREQDIIIKKGRYLTYERKIGPNYKSAMFMEIYISTIRDFLQKEGYEA